MERREFQWQSDPSKQSFVQPKGVSASFPSGVCQTMLYSRVAPLRVRGLARVQLHADLCILARLGLALSRARAVPLAA